MVVTDGLGCKVFGGPAKAHRILAAQVTGGVLRPRFPHTDLATPLREYSTSPLAVPGYLVWHPRFAARFQLTIPKIRDFERFAGRSGIEFVKMGPGDHRTYRIGKRKFQVNGKGSDMDIASLKALCRIVNIPAHELSTRIRSGKGASLLPV